VITGSSTFQAVVVTGEYGPVRLLTSPHRLAERIAPRCSDATVALLTGPLQRMPELAVPRGEREQYAAHLDELRRALAAHLTARWTPDRAQST
jgi:hypothetical protein